MKRLTLTLAVGAVLALVTHTAWADSFHGAADPSKGSVQLVRHGHGGHGGYYGHGGWNHSHHHGHGGWGVYYYPRPHVYPRPYVYPYPVYPYPAYPYGYSGVTVYGPRVGVSIGF